MMDNHYSELLLSLVLAVLFPLLLGLAGGLIVEGLKAAFIVAIIIFPIVVVFRIVWEWNQSDNPMIIVLLRYLRPVPPGAIYNSELKSDGLPVVTISIILINGLLFLVLPETIVDRLVFFPYGTPTVYEKLVSVFTSAFLHGGTAHFGYNMIFLWAFGSVLETRIGWRRFVCCYLIAIVGSKALVLVLLSIQAHSSGNPELVDSFHSLGASGAISGIMGLFIVRCFYADVSLAVPVLIIPIPLAGVLSIPLQVRAPLLVGLFFTFDVSGSISQFNHASSHVNYWSHVGGYLTGIIIGLAMGLYRESACDAAKTKAARYRSDKVRSAEALSHYRQVLVHEPDNLEALTYLFSCLHKRGSQEAGQYFSDLIRATVKKDIATAVNLCREHLPQNLPHVPSKTAAYLGFHFFRNAELKLARHLLERASNAKGPWQPKAILTLAKTFVGMGNKDMAKKVFKQAVDKFPGTLFEIEAQRQIQALHR
jgi:membrane associated rhomboid family serine protease